MVITPGKTLRQMRERLQLKYRHVEEASLQLAYRNKNSEFAIGLSRLADIEHKGTVPSIFRLYSLSVIYGLDYSDLLSLYGVPLSHIPADLAELQLQVSRPVSIYSPVNATTSVPLKLLSKSDFRKTGFLAAQAQEWGRLPIQLLEGYHQPGHKYAVVGLDDWSMHPLIRPGSFVQIDATKSKIINANWENDFVRPIYMLETRRGFRFGWCTEQAGTLIVQSHTTALVQAEAHRFPGDVEVVGQVIGVAMRLDREKQRRKRSSLVPG